MDYVTRQFINLTKKFRKESRKYLIALQNAVEKNTKTAEKATDAYKEQSKTNSLILSAINEPRFHVHEKRTLEQPRNPTQWLKLSIEIATLVVIAAYTALSAYQLVQLKISADAAKDSSDISREALESVQRAFVVFAGFEPFRNVIDATPSGNVPTLVFQAIWENGGTTPATRVVQHFDIAESPSEPTGTQFIGTPDAQTYSVIGPKARQDIGPIKKPEAFFMPRGKNKYAWGWITYRDVFPNTKTHLTEFCLRVNGGVNFVPLPNSVHYSDKTHVEFAIDPNSNVTLDLGICRAHNCTDEDCQDYNAVVRVVPSTK